MDVVVGKAVFKNRIHTVIGLNGSAGCTEGGDYNGYRHLLLLNIYHDFCT